MTADWFHHKLFIQTTMVEEYDPSNALVNTSEAVVEAQPASQFAHLPPGADIGAHEGRKLFIAGVSFDTTEASLRTYFAQFGDLEEAVIMVDKFTHRSRGFAFVTYRTKAPVERVMNTRLELDGRKLDPQVCNFFLRCTNHLFLTLFFRCQLRLPFRAKRFTTVRAIRRNCLWAVCRWKPLPTI
jgi:hypothetical protein